MGHDCEIIPQNFDAATSDKPCFRHHSGKLLGPNNNMLSLVGCFPARRPTMSLGIRWFHSTDKTFCKNDRTAVTFNIRYYANGREHDFHQRQHGGTAQYLCLKMCDARVPT